LLLIIRKAKAVEAVARSPIIWKHDQVDSAGDAAREFLLFLGEDAPVGVQTKI
jgi:hypothetical protein